MKKNINVLLSLFLMTMISSCLKAGLEELPAYEDADITNFKFEYRWFDDAKNRMCVEQMTVKTIIDKENLIVTCDITVPKADDDFPKEIRDGVSLSNLVGYCDISTAAVIAPVGDSPKLGEIQDFSTQNEMSYKVTAANGDSKTWTLKIDSFNK